MPQGPQIEETAVEDQYAMEHEQRRFLALIAHNHMKPAMLQFVKEHVHVLKHFKITGTASTLRTVKAVFKEYGVKDSVAYGPLCSSGPLGGDAQIAAQLAFHQIGGIIFFEDPLSAHPHIADVHSLRRLALVHNVLLALNTTSADAMINILEQGLSDKTLIPSFYKTLASPAVSEYLAGQNKIVQSLVSKVKHEPHHHHHKISRKADEHLERDPVHHLSIKHPEDHVGMCHHELEGLAVLEDAHHAHTIRGEDVHHTDTIRANKRKRTEEITSSETKKRRKKQQRGETQQGKENEKPVQRKREALKSPLKEFLSGLGSSTHAKE